MLRVRSVNDRAINPGGAFVLYWMIASRRPTSNFALDRAVEWAIELGRPLVVLEALRADYPHASERLHRFVLDGMLDNRDAFGRSPVLYHPYVEPDVGAGRGLIERLSESAAIVVTDEYPCFFLPRAVAAASARVHVRMETVDGNGLLPLAAAPRAYPAAVHFRRFIQSEFRRHIVSGPLGSPRLDQLPPRLTSLPADVSSRWPAATDSLLGGSSSALAALPIDHVVPAVTMKGGAAAAGLALRQFLEGRLTTYAEHQAHPDDRGTSRLSPYLHFGHISVHQVFDAVMRHEHWNIGKLGAAAKGARQGWWGVRPGAEAFLDQLVVWRELAFNTCAKRPDEYGTYEGLPSWARETLDRHTGDSRPVLYDRATLENAATHDRVWNAAQREMRRDGWMHNYMRMLWGKKILEWSETPRQALDTMISLMNRWALDGRDPNSYAGYMWTLGRYDRPWPERPIFGTVRYMSSESAVKKLRVRKYLAEDDQATLFE